MDGTNVREPETCAPRTKLAAELTCCRSVRAASQCFSGRISIAAVVTRGLVRRGLPGCALLETVIPVLGHPQNRIGHRAGQLALGDHAVADELRDPSISPTPVAISSFLDHRSILPAGHPTLSRPIDLTQPDPLRH